MTKIKIIIVAITVISILILLTAIFLNQTAKKLKSESSDELYNTKNRTKALEKAGLAVTLWPFDRSHKHWLNNLEEIKDRSAIIIFIKESNQDEIQQLETEIRSIKGVKEVKFVSKEEALRIYKEINKNDPALLDLITSDILPESIEVYLDDFTVRDQIEQLAKRKAFVTDVIQSI